MHPTMTAKKRNTLLWKIHHKASDHTSFLFGTMHVRDRSAFFENQHLLSSIDQSDSFYAEFDFKEVDPELTTKYFMLPDNQRISDHLKPKRLASLERLLEKTTGSSLAEVDHLKPMILINLISESLFKQDYAMPLDQYLYQYADSKGKKMGGVESFAEQLEVLEKISIKEQFRSLTALIKKQKAHKRQIRKMGRYYRKMEIDKLYKAARSSAKGMRKELIYKRNRIMADRMAVIALEENAFFAVGAGHLAGSKGVLRFLKHHGFKVKPVKLVVN